MYLPVVISIGVVNLNYDSTLPTVISISYGIELNSETIGKSVKFNILGCSIVIGNNEVTVPLTKLIS